MNAAKIWAAVTSALPGAGPTAATTAAAAPAHLRRGADAEDAALAHLQARGLALVARNYRCPAGELDIVMLERGVLVFVEVRYRHSGRFGGAAASVDAAKQQKLQHAGEAFLQTCRLPFTACRFDVVAISGSGPAYQLDWIRNAF